MYFTVQLEFVHPVVLSQFTIFTHQLATIGTY